MNKKINIQTLILILGGVVACQFDLYAQTSPAPVYYIDFQDGNDQNNGLTQSTAWKTIPGTYKTDGSAYLRTCWGPTAKCTVDSGNHKLPLGTIFKMKPGTTHNSQNGGWIFINGDFYKPGGSKDDPYLFEPDLTWAKGSVVFDGTGMILPQALILIRQIDGVRFDGLSDRGITIMNSPLTGIQYKSVSYTTPDIDPVVNHVYFYNNGTSDATDTAGASEGGLHLENTTGGSVAYCEFNGNQQYINGLIAGEYYESASNLTVSNSISYNHKGDLVGNDSGIGFKALNGSITFMNDSSFNNLKGFDLGGHKSLSPTSTFKVIDSLIYNNIWGINFSRDPTSFANDYLINNIIRNNDIGSNIYFAGASNVYIVHNVYANNGDPTLKDQGNLMITPDTAISWEAVINAYLYNNIFYKPQALKYAWNFRNGAIGDGTAGFLTHLSIDSDYNSWVALQDGQVFSYLDFQGGVHGALYLPPSQFTSVYNYGPNGPGHLTGLWYSTADMPGGAASGHLHCDAHSKGTLADDPALPPFTNLSSNDFSLTAHYAGTDLTQKPWYIPEMGLDRNGNNRTSWDIGSYEFIPTAKPITYSLSVTNVGNGYGEVFSSDGNINCGVNSPPPVNNCNETVNNGTTITLTATPATGSVFSGWSGACSGTGSCTVTMNTAQNMSATFTAASVNGACGTASQTYLYQATGFGSNTLCKSGNPYPATVTFPAPGGSVQWTCQGSNGGLNKTCKARRNSRVIFRL